MNHKQLKIITPKQFLQRIPIKLALRRAGNASENLLNKIRQIMYSLYQEKEITKKAYNNVMNSIKLKNKMGIISKDSKTLDSCRLLPNLTDKINLKRSGK